LVWLAFWCGSFFITARFSYIKSPMPQFWPQQREAPQVDWAGQAGSFAPEFVWAAGALMFFVKSCDPQDGHPGFASP
jgi:hypothetical protein